MIGNFLIRRGSTLPWLDVQITQDGFTDLNLSANAPKGCATAPCGDKDNLVDLTGAQVSFELYTCGRTPMLVSTLGTTEIVDETCGTVRFKWAGGDLPAPYCLFYGVFVVKMIDGTVLRWPYAKEQLAIEVRD